MLTDMKVRTAKPGEKRYRLADGNGLYLDVRENGAKSWLLRFIGKDGKRHWHSIGDYPVFSLSEARVRAFEIRKEDAELKEAPRKAVPFKKVAMEFFEVYQKQVDSEKTKRLAMRKLELHVFPYIGDSDIASIGSKEMLEIVERMASRDIGDTARRVTQFCSRIFKYGILKEYCTSDPCYALRSTVSKTIGRRTKHFSAVIEPDQVADLMRRIEAYPQPVVRLAMRFSALTFCRPGEIRRAEWSEIDMDKKQWIIPASKMKMKRDHIVPLSTQALDVLRQLRPLTGSGMYLFPNSRAPKGDRPMSENTVLVALRSMGYEKSQMTAHGFRTMASTMLNEHGLNRDWIEMQLAHAPLDQVRDAYNRAKYMRERTDMMQKYADLLDGLRDGTTTQE